jgi:hypothetical protein
MKCMLLTFELAVFKPESFFNFHDYLRIVLLLTCRVKVERHYILILEREINDINIGVIFVCVYWVLSAAPHVWKLSTTEIFSLP